MLLLNEFCRESRAAGERGAMTMKDTPAAAEGKGGGEGKGGDDDDDDRARRKGRETSSGTVGKETGNTRHGNGPTPECTCPALSWYLGMTHIMSTFMFIFFTRQRAGRTDGQRGTG